MDDNVNNFFKNISGNLKEELTEVILEQGSVRIERIVSMGHASPPGFWYDQDRDEFVILLKGSAGLLFDGKDEISIMAPGDYVNIPARTRHRVEWTDKSVETVWLAMYY
ncbi:MAG: cupin domain-containing protein [Deltaproteobacteria bacterium]|nr:cupin domain-containing protein [Deltaproteobacteria bacterium]